MNKKWRCKKKEEAERLTDIEASYKLYVSRLREVHELMHDKRSLNIIEQYKARRDMLERAAEVLKTAARMVAVVGKKTIAIADENAVVEVLGMPGQIRYDDELAKAEWPDSVLSQVLVVDPMAVKRAIDDGLLSEKMANVARLPDNPVTPRVSIKVVK